MSSHLGVLYALSGDEQDATLAKQILIELANAYWLNLGMTADEYQPLKNAKHLLLVDVLPAGKVLNHILSTRGKHSVIMVSSHEEALDRIKESAGFDAVITSMHLAGTNGVQLTKKIKELYPKLPVILTGWSLIGMENGVEMDYGAPGSVEEIPADIILLQPIRIEELLNAVIKVTNQGGSAKGGARTSDDGTADTFRRSC